MPKPVAGSHRVGGRYVSGTKKGLGNKWERNYAAYLDFLVDGESITAWQREPVTFWFCKIGKQLKGEHVEPNDVILKRAKGGVVRGVRSYKPDFRIVNIDGSICYHEVKGFLDKQSKTKLKRMEKYYPDVKIRVVTSKNMREIAKWSKLIKGWEE
jgi:hypothetical protein